MQVREAYEEYRFYILKLATTTQTWYTSRLEAFCQWCEQQGLELENIKPTTVANYLEHLKTTVSTRAGKLRSSATVHGHVRAIRTFLNWCTRQEDYENVISARTPKNIPMPKLIEPIIPILEDKDIKAMMASCEEEFLPWLVAFSEYSDQHVGTGLYTISDGKIKINSETGVLKDVLVHLVHDLLA